MLCSCFNMNGHLIILHALILVIFRCESFEYSVSIDYFKHKNITIVCILSCQDHHWTQVFTKKLMAEKMTVSSVDIRKPYYFYEKRTKICLRQKFDNIGVFIEAQCSSFGNVMYLASSGFFLDSNHHWLIIDDIIDRTNLTMSNVSNGEPEEWITYDDDLNVLSKAVNTLKSLNISVNADIVLATEKAANSYSILDIFNFGKERGGKFNTVFIGFWTTESGLVMKKTGYKYLERWDFKQLTLRMIVVSSNATFFHPNMLTSLKPIPEIDIITKVASTILKVIEDANNLRFKYTVADRWIDKFTRNNSKVVAPSLYFREQDLTPLLRMNGELLNKIDFVQPPVTSIATRFYYRIPSSGVGKFENQFLTPLSTEVWWCIVAVLFLCGTILFAAAKIERRPSSVQFAVFTVIASVCQQFFEDVTEVRRDSMARKSSLLVTGLSCMLLYNYYTSSVVSWLLNGSPPSIRSLLELTESSLDVIFEDIGYTKSWLQVPGYYYNKGHARDEDELRKKKVFNKKTSKPLLMSLEEGIDRLKAGGYAFHAQVANANARISQIFDKMELCELGSLESMEKSMLYPGLQKNSPYKKFLSWSLIRLKERGHFSYVQRRMASPDISCDGSVPRALALGGAAPAFVILGSGFLVALLALVCEILIHRLTQEKYAVLRPFIN